VRSDLTILGRVIENREVTAGSSGAVLVDHGDHVEVLEAW
jgi:hypothetical protein